MGRKKCAPKLSDRCFSRVSAKCVDYEGKLPKCTNIDEDDCLNVEEIIEEVIDKVDELCLTGFEGEGCIDYTPSDPSKGLSLEDILLAHDREICNLQGGDGGVPPAGDPVDNCGNPIVSCCEVLKYYGAWEGDFDLERHYLDPSNGDVSYQIQEVGTYKFTIDSVFSEMSNIQIGLFINENPPSQTLFEEMKMFSQFNNTVHFIKSLQPGDIAKIKYNEGMVGNYNSLKSFKLIVEKVR